MINSKPLPRQAPVGDHLLPEQLFAFLAGRVPLADKHQLEVHLQTCTLCTEALEGFITTDAAAAQASLLELNHLIRKRTARRKKNTLLTDIKNWGVATAIIFLLIISAAIVWNALQHNNQVPTMAPPANRAYIYAQPVNGYEQLNTYLKQQTSLAVLPPGTVRKKGQVVLTFTVNPDSSLRTFAVVKSLGKAYDRAAINLIKRGPAWQPAFSQEQPKAQKVTLRVYFK